MLPELFCYFFQFAPRAIFYLLVTLFKPLVPLKNMHVWPISTHLLMYLKCLSRCFPLTDQKFQVYSFINATQSLDCGRNLTFVSFGWEISFLSTSTPGFFDGLSHYYFVRYKFDCHRQFSGEKWPKQSVLFFRILKYFNRFWDILLCTRF